MLAYIEGRLLERAETNCVLVTAGGVGYEIFLPEHALASLPAQGGMASFFTSFIVREDAQELFGFPSWDERQTLLSQYRPDDLRRIVAEDDANALTRVPGIGKKTAQQIFLELKYKLKPGDDPVSFSAPAGAAPANTVYRDALTGLANLGYDEDMAGPLLKEALAADPDLSVGEALRAVLKAVGKGKM